MPAVDVGPKVTPEIVAEHGLTSEEFERIKRILGREPNFTELGIFSVMWSEHCSYKNSRKELRKFPTTGSNILVKAGEENAGVVDIGDGWAIAFKIESHNHPSAIEPFQGAATGVGGIIRDIFTMGARPEFCLNSLRFGPIVASSELTEESGEDRPAVQVGDPFKEKLLLEACLELLASDAVAGIQDMGAAGLTCSTCETASRGDSGVEIDLAKVPKREPGMTPYEILLSESQERMLIIAKRGREAEVREVFAKWDVPCAQIEQVTADGMMHVSNSGTTLAEIPAKPLAKEAPIYEREARKLTTDYANYTDLRKEISALSAVDALKRLLADPTIASKNWVYRQYDHMVRTGTVVKPGSDAAVFFVRYANKILAATTDCNSL